MKLVDDREDAPESNGGWKPIDVRVFVSARKVRGRRVAHCRKMRISRGVVFGRAFGPAIRPIGKGAARYNVFVDLDGAACTNAYGHDVSRGANASIPRCQCGMSVACGMRRGGRSTTTTSDVLGCGQASPSDRKVDQGDQDRVVTNRDVRNEMMSSRSNERGRGHPPLLSS